MYKDNWCNVTSVIHKGLKKQVWSCQRICPYRKNIKLKWTSWSLNTIKEVFFFSWYLVFRFSFAQNLNKSFPDSIDQLKKNQKSFWPINAKTSIVWKEGNIDFNVFPLIHKYDNTKQGRHWVLNSSENVFFF